MYLLNCIADVANHEQIFTLFNQIVFNETLESVYNII